MCYNEIPRLGGLNNRNLCSHSSGAWMSKTRLPACSNSGESSPLAFSLFPHMAFLWYVHVERACSLVSLFTKALIHQRGPSPINSHHPNYLSEAHLQIPSLRRLWLQHLNVRGHKHSAHNKYLI